VEPVDIKPLLKTRQFVYLWFMMLTSMGYGTYVMLEYINFGSNTIKSNLFLKMIGVIGYL
jgi:hypothetical protein